jgi:hypothetical protein
MVTKYGSTDVLNLKKHFDDCRKYIRRKTNANLLCIKYRNGSLKTERLVHVMLQVV